MIINSMKTWIVMFTMTSFLLLQMPPEAQASEFSFQAAPSSAMTSNLPFQILQSNGQVKSTLDSAYIWSYFIPGLGQCLQGDCLKILIYLGSIVGIALGTGLLINILGISGSPVGQIISFISSISIVVVHVLNLMDAVDVAYQKKAEQLGIASLNEPMPVWAPTIAVRVWQF